MPALHCPLYWPRAIILVDMNAFFASIEQQDFPELRARPIAVTNGTQGTCIITASYEARRFGIRTGMRLPEAKRLCPELIQCPARPERYAAISTAIMAALQDITPDMEVFSVDEAFLDVTHCQALWGNPVLIGRMAQQRVYAASGLLCSIGISGDKTTAKYAAKCQKPHGFTVIPPWEARERLSKVPATALCGIAEGIGRFLASYGAYTCGDVAKLPISILAKRFGPLGKRIWWMCQGLDPDPIHTTVADPKSMGHGKVMPPNTRDRSVVLTFLQHMSEKLGCRLRRHSLETQHLSVGLRSHTHGWLGGKVRLIKPSNDSRLLYQHSKAVLLNVWQDQPVWQIQLTATEVRREAQQLDMFNMPDPKTQARNQVMDAINRRYGEFSLSPASLLNRSRMPNVISPAWKPVGHRQTIVKA